MNILNVLVLLFCLLAPMALIYWLRQAHKQAQRDRHRWIEDAPEDAEKPATFLDLKNDDNFDAWRRRWIEAHPQTIVVQRFPSQQLRADVMECERSAPAWLRRDVELPALLRRQAG